MIGWADDIEHATLSNDTFRTVLHTGEDLQLTAMRLAPGEDIGGEVHPEGDQFVRVEAGHARLELSRLEDRIEETYDLEADGAAIIPAGTWHNVVNAGAEELKLYSLYAPPQHPAGAVHPTKADSVAAHEGHSS
jgi:mannose-6-phosphate isomerase-like protein (cupin superfamily)